MKLEGNERGRRRNAMERRGYAEEIEWNREDMKFEILRKQACDCGGILSQHYWLGMQAF